MHETATTGGFILQAAVDDFEAELGRFLGIDHVVGLSDCTNAMLLGLRASGLQPGDEVIMPSHGFIAAAQSIHFAGGMVVPVELSEHDWLIGPRRDRGRDHAAHPRDHAGPCQRPHLPDGPDHGASPRRMAWAVFEDAAQAAGATFDGKPAGGFGAWGTYSFYPSKTLGCFGDAGALVTNDGAVADLVRAMRNHGANAEKRIPDDCAIWGTNARLDNIHAAILGYKLTYYAEAIARRREIAARYHDAFKDIAALDLPPAPDSDPRYFDIYQNYEMCCDGRDALRAHLSAHGIGTIVQWGGTGIHQFRNLGFTQDLPLTDRFFARSLLLPMNHILTDAQVSAVIDRVREHFA